MIERQRLKKSILLCGKSGGPTRFTITKNIDSSGASSICYKARHEGSGIGVLKEFYPTGCYALERDENGQLICPPQYEDATVRFHEAEKAYTVPYEMLLKLRQGDNQELAAILPPFEILHGCSEDGNITGTTYIWTPTPECKTFADICDDIHKRPDSRPEHNLVLALSAIDSLTKCICTLHSAGLLHRDIKPANFGFLKRGNEILTQMPSLFDVNSVCSVFGEELEKPVCSEGYTEPEFRYELANNKTDIYSIGASLFHAIVISDEVEAGEYIYRPEYYPRLRDMVNGSKLIRASEANSHPRLRNILTIILQKCLSDRGTRYESCEELIEDIQTALYYALPSEVARKVRSGEKWILANTEKSLDANKDKNSLRTIQYHLYEHPLYRCLANSDSIEKSSINVLIIGLGNYAQKFLDVCLQVGQIRIKKLNVTVISDDSTDKEIYLSDRPELDKFFDIDEALNSKDSYGHITFKVTKLNRDDLAANAVVMQDIISHCDDRLHYIFIALGDDKLNFSAANACKTSMETSDTGCIVSYICEGSECESNSATVSESPVEMYSLHVNSDVKNSELYPELDRMAFNTHLVWFRHLNDVDYKEIKEDFRKPYNYDSCLSHVITMKYRLWSIGIDLEKMTFAEAARQFKENLSGCIKDELIWLEHRRWVTEKLCLGFRNIPNLDDCSGGMTKDEKNKLHICIRKSRPDQLLAAYDYQKWDSASDSELALLDELDRMSVDLHRMYVCKAKIARKQNLLSGEMIISIKALLDGNREAFVAFQEWYTCLKEIWDGDTKKVHLYEGLKTAFLKVAKRFSPEIRDILTEQVKALQAMFYPILASIEYRDWKQSDTVLIENIPFVLTYTEDSYMVIPFSAGDSSTELFNNVATPTVINPARIIYLYLIEKQQDVQALKEVIPCLIRYMDKKKFKAAVDFVILYLLPPALMKNDNFEKEIQELGGGRIKIVKLIRLTDLEDASTKLSTYIKQRSEDKAVFMLEKNETSLSRAMQMTGLYNSFPSYKFDSGTLEFYSVKNCEMLNYISKRPCITVTEMAALRLSSSKSSNHPEFFSDYQSLWTEYCSNTFFWKVLCDVLKKYSEHADVIMSFRKKKLSEKCNELKTEMYRYIIPSACNRSVKKIIEFMKKQDLIEQESCINDYTSNSCEVKIFDRCGYSDYYDNLFGRIYALILPETINPRLNTKTGNVDIVFDNLVVRGVSIAGNRTEKLCEVLEYFRDQGYIINLNFNPDNQTISFTYATPQIKELLTTAGKILEIYTYHKVKELGQFDDVVSSFEIDWEDTDVKNEFDCIVTKGFRSLFIECKARGNLEQDVYFKLSTLANRFGVNATAVLIADTQEKGTVAAVNAMQRRRGNMLDIITIWKHDEIDDIGNTLLKVINGTYTY